MSLLVERFDHIVLNCRDARTTASRHESAPGAAAERPGPGGRRPCGSLAEASSDDG